MTGETAPCDLHLALGRVEACPGNRCPFWEDELGACAVRHLAKTEHSPELADWLLELRRRLESAHETDDLQEIHSELQALLPPGLRS